MTPYRYRAYPWHALPVLTADDARVATALAQLVAATTAPTWARIRRLLRLDPTAAIRARILPRDEPDPRAFDPHAACCEVRVDGGRVQARGTSAAVRALAQRVLGGPEELAAPRPLDEVESSVWTLVVATLLEDLGVAGDVWPSTYTARGEPAVSVELVLGELRVAIAIDVPVAVAIGITVPRRDHAALARSRAWLDASFLELPVVAGRCALHRDDLARLAVRSLITLDRPASGATWDVDVLDGVVGVADRTSGQGAHLVVTTGYRSRDMSLPDEAHVELTVTVGTTRLSLRQLTELAVGQIIKLHRPLGGPFELRAAGRILGRAELVDVDGELAVRIVSLGD